MTRQKVESLTAWGDTLRVWNDKDGTIWYRYDIDKGGSILTTFMIRIQKGRYVITPTEDETYVRYKGTKKNCLAWLSGYIEECLRYTMKK